MKKAILRNNAHHEAGHWVTGWIMGGQSGDIELTMPADGKWVASCGREPNPDFDDLNMLNTHLGHRIINLISGAKAESLSGEGFNHEIYRYLVSDGNGAWPDFFIASELFRFFYRSLSAASRKSYEEEWRELEAISERIVLDNRKFISKIGCLTLERYIKGNTEIIFTRDELVSIFAESN
ncbi:Uncharacterised protein [Serratia quinivorans]|uniref:hypothetical protein n=1 Tax=Serratia quinivorans TaxID=137545 RepID=UPI00217A35B7|nr:hypothetical protein [Serratia quinivorans]CAI0836618.1 Uncharacterised protein [Serratia quinivorans]